MKILIQPADVRALTFGEIPLTATLEARFVEACVEGFSYRLQGRDAETADDLGLDVDGEGLDADEFRDVIETLATSWQDGNERAGDLASAFLQSIGLEWI